MRLIDADALKRDLTRFYDNEVTAKELIDEQPTAVGWICLTGHITDVMPKDGVFVLVCNDEGKMMIAKYESELVRWEYKYTNYDWDVWDDEEQGHIRYWMPLPEPPKEDENG